MTELLFAPFGLLATGLLLWIFWPNVVCLFGGHKHYGLVIWREVRCMRCGYSRQLDHVAFDEWSRQKALAGRNRSGVRERD